MYNISIINHNHIYQPGQAFVSFRFLDLLLTIAGSMRSSVVLLLFSIACICAGNIVKKRETAYTVEGANTSTSTRVGRMLVATAASDKAVLQGLSRYVGSKISPAWTSTGDPCNDAWGGVVCDATGYVTGIDLNNKALAGLYRHAHVVVLQ